jgi:hypothetical protein
MLCGVIKNTRGEALAEFIVHYTFKQGVYQHKNIARKTERPTEMYENTDMYVENIFVDDMYDAVYM